MFLFFNICTLLLLPDSLSYLVPYHPTYTPTPATYEQGQELMDKWTGNMSPTTTTNNSNKNNNAVGEEGTGPPGSASSSWRRHNYRKELSDLQHAKPLTGR